MRSITLILLAISLLQADIRVTSGAADDQVFQRQSAAVDITISGTADERDGSPVEARVTRKHIVISDWSPLAKLTGGKWSGALKDLRTGGPYRIELRCGKSQTVVNNILVGDLWVLAGQSNMQGVGDLVNVEQPHELVHNFDMADRWMIAEEPLHTLPTALDPVHWPKGQTAPLSGDALANFLANRKKGAGLGLPFAVEMVRRTGVPVGLLSCAHGGTSMDQWDPALKNKAGESLYGSMYRRIQATGGKVTGVLWYQGESDANPKAAPVFLQKFERFVSAVREDLGRPDLPFYYVQIGRHVNDTNVAEWNVVQDMQRRAESSISRSGVVAAIDTSLDDGIHVGTQDLKRVGKRLAILATGQAKRGPRPVSATFNAGILRVAFSDVNGRLTSQGRISGFSVHNDQGAAVPLIYKARVDPEDGNAILLHIGGKLPQGATLRYGFGKDPYCNVRDQADMALPVFGPMPVQQ